MKTVAIFGSTGSIGTQSLDVLSRGNFSVTALSALKNERLLIEQAKRFSARTILGQLSDERIREQILDAEYVINAVPGFDGLAVSIEALKMGKTLLSANKESLAIAGNFLKKIALENNAEIRPLDSEANAIWQLANEHGRENVKSVTLTCSGGPFYGKNAQELSNVSVSEALAHPTWKMGPKVSLDSATLINKVLEIYEVHHLFDIPLRDIHIVIHRQSLVHSMIHTHTGATKMKISPNDMRIPIFHALHHPENLQGPFGHMRISKSELSFDQADAETFRSLKWLALHKGNPNFPIVLNALNDLATTWFLKGEIGFLEIYDFVETELEKFIYRAPPKTLEELIGLHKKITHEYRDHTRRRLLGARGAK